MTRDELIEIVVDSLAASESETCDRHYWAQEAINTIFAALKEPTEEMSDAGVKSDVLLSAIIDWQGSYTPKEDVASDIWELMLSASPLAPSKEKK